MRHIPNPLPALVGGAKTLLRNGRMDGSERHTGLIHEIEALARRAWVLVLVIPVLLVVGHGAGRLVSHSLSIPAGTEVRQATAEAIPRQRLYSLADRMEEARTAGVQTADYIRTYQTEVAPVEHVLRDRGVPSSIARRVAWPLVEQSYRNGVEPATVLSVLLLESGGRPRATSAVGARGLMQVMPAWSGFWGGCSRDLYDIEGNLCNGTSILAWYMDRFGGDEQRALLGYNGCVTGSITPNCRQYPEKVARLRHQLRNELALARRKTDRGAAGADE